jgi:hypothetical protein
MENILIALLFIIIFVCLYKKNIIDKLDFTIKEQFQTYIQHPYNYVKTGSDPVNFYRLDRYRKPYRYPFKYFKSYPVPHMAHLEE